MFSLENEPGLAPVKLPQIGKVAYAQLSICCLSSYGPIFGTGHDFAISNYASTNSKSHSILGLTYNLPAELSQRYGNSFDYTFLAGTTSFTPDEVETFYETSKK